MFEQIVSNQSSAEKVREAAISISISIFPNFKEAFS